MNTERSIFTYTDYREFLRDYFAGRKKAHPAFSHRQFAGRAGFKTSNFMYLVMGGRRNLTLESIQKVAAAMQMKKRERDYFESLVFLCQAQTVEAKELHLARLNGMRKGAFHNLIGGDRFEYIANWLHPVVRELAAMARAETDEKELAAQIASHVTPAEIRKSLELLTRLGLLIKSPDGAYRQSEALLSTGPGVTGVAAAQYHLGVIALAADSINRFKPQERELVGMTLGVSREAYEKIRDRMWEFRQEVLALADDPAPDAVYQLNIQLFPMTKGKK